MNKVSKENQILELFFNSPKYWHFSHIKKEVKIADNKLSRWLKIFQKQNLIKKIKEKDKMPYYISNQESAEYQNTKRIFALKKFHETGFLNHLTELKGADTVIIFGSFSRWDWHKDSDIDLFIYGDDSELDILKFQKILKREIQVFNYKTFEELRKTNIDLIDSIIKDGYKLKGTIDFLEVILNEQTG
jgi:predicted nucleotidyltransferase